MKEVRVGIVGMGVGRANARGFVKTPRARVVALCDLLEDRMAEFAAELPGPVKCVTDYKELCRDAEVDAVFVGTPNQWHVPVALEAIQREKHVLVTKPLADTTRAARRLVKAAGASGLVHMMSLSTRFGDACCYLDGLARAGEFGELYYARARSIRRAGIPDWSLGFIEKGGGAFRDMGVHVLDAAWSLLGQPRPVTVTGVAGAKFGPRGQGYWHFRQPPRSFYRKYASDDYGGGFIRFENGAGLQVESFWACHQAPEFQIELFGTEAGARLRPLTLYKTVAGAPQDIQVDPPEGRDVWTAIAAHFVECILDGVECRAPLGHGLIVQEMMEALLTSAERGREVRIRA
jgi:predicted dehydrogenase